MAQIGIKLADGTFYPLMDDGAPRRIRVLLSPARVEQRGVQIDIIRREDDRDQYAGCLVLEDLTIPESGDLELVLGLDREGTLDARVGDTTGERYQSLSVSLSHLDEQKQFSLPEDTDPFSLGVGEAGSPIDLEMPDVDMPDLDDLQFEDDLDVSGVSYDEAPYEDATYDGADSVDDTPQYRETTYDDTDQNDTDEYDADEYDADEIDDGARRFNPVILVAIILITLSVIALGAYGVLRLLGASMLPELRATLVLLSGTPLWGRSAGKTVGTER